MKPWMSDADIKHIERILLDIGSDHISVLEWGSGGSTIYFTEFLRNNGIGYDWTSIEYNKEWLEKIKSEIIPDTSLVLFDTGNTKLKQRLTNMDEYVEYPLTLNKKFDFILVDGRKRRRCLINASKLVSDGGTVALHDAERKYYHCAFNHYSEHKFLSKTLWSGKCYQ